VVKEPFDTNILIDYPQDVYPVSAEPTAGQFGNCSLPLKTSQDKKV
jgi:hypothetical protein